MQQGIVQDYPPLCDAKGAMTAQFVRTTVLESRADEWADLCTGTYDIIAADSEGDSQPGR